MIHYVSFTLFYLVNFYVFKEMTIFNEIDKILDFNT